MTPNGTDKPLFIRLSLPSGLEESLEGLAREVLRSQPKNIYEFAAEHFEELLRKRNKGNKSCWSLPCSNLQLCFLEEQGFPVDKDISYVNGRLDDSPRSSSSPVERKDSPRNEDNSSEHFLFRLQYIDD